MAEGDLEEAGAYIEEALKKVPMDAQANFLRGMLMAQTAELAGPEARKFIQHMRMAFSALQEQEASIFLAQTSSYVQQLISYAKAEEQRLTKTRPAQEQVPSYRSRICRVATLYQAANEGLSEIFLQQQPEYLPLKKELAQSVITLCDLALEPFYFTEALSRGQERIVLEEPSGMIWQNCHTYLRSCMIYLEKVDPELALQLKKAPLLSQLETAQEERKEKEKRYRIEVLSRGGIALIAIFLLPALEYHGYYWESFVSYIPMVFMLWFFGVFFSWKKVRPYRKRVREMKEQVRELESAQK